MSEPLPPRDWFSQAAGLVFRPLRQIRERPVRWLDFPFLQAAAFHLLAGQKGAGKGTWLAETASRFSRGELGERCHVIWAALGEDSYGVDVRPRLRAADAVLDRITVVEGVPVFPADVAAVQAEIARQGDVGLLVVDPLGGALAERANSNLDSDVRPMLAALNDLADASGVTIIGIRHFSNKAKGDAVAAVLGSSDWVNIPRAVLGLLHDDNDPALRHLCVLAGNRAPSGTPGRVYAIDGARLSGHDAEVPRMAPMGRSTKDPDKLLGAGRPSSRLDLAGGRDALLALLGSQPEQTMACEALDRQVHKLTGIPVPQIKAIRFDLRDEGLIAFLPLGRDDDLEVSEWGCRLTFAAAEESLWQE